MTVTASITTIDPLDGALRATDPRVSMTVLPRWSQGLLTTLTGRPLDGQERRFKWTPAFHVAGGLANLVVGLAAGLWLARSSYWWALPLAWVVMLHGMRNLRMMILHQSSHGNLFRRPGLDKFFGRLVTGMLVVQNYKTYSAEHVEDHHAVRHMTLSDPTVQAMLVGLGLSPKMTTDQMWARLRGRLLSPVFHLRFSWSRLRSFIAGAHWVEILICLLLQGGLLVGGWFTGHLLAVLLAWFLPLTVFYQVSNTLRLCVKHTFPAPGHALKGKAHFGSLTNAIFMGETLPSGFLPRVRWVLRTAFVHAPARYLVLTGDTVVHDFHHRNPRTKNWADYIYARHADAARQDTGWPSYTGVWGLHAGIQRVFESLAAADPTEYDAALIARVSDRNIFSAFDD